MKPKTCKVCKEKFVPVRSMQSVCGLSCAIEQGKKVSNKQRQEKAKQERKETKDKKEKLKPRKKWIQEVQEVVNAYVRWRDRFDGCISCGASPPDMSKLHAGRDAGHYRSVGSAPHLRFNLDNIHAQCVKCNQFGSGMAVDYRIRLIRKIGIERVEALEADQTPGKWTIEELKEMKAHYAKLRREIEKEKGKG